MSKYLTPTANGVLGFIVGETIGAFVGLLVCVVAAVVGLLGLYTESSLLLVAFLIASLGSPFFWACATIGGVIGAFRGVEKQDPPSKARLKRPTAYRLPGLKLRGQASPASISEEPDPSTGAWFLGA